MKRKYEIQTFCLNADCNYFRNHEHIYQEFVSNNKELGKHLFSLRNFMSYE